MKTNQSRNANHLSQLKWILILTITTLSLGWENRACAQSSENASFHMQSTVVTQHHGAFSSPYSGINSLSASPDTETSLTWTLFWAHQLWHNAQFIIDPELAGGSGFNKTQGIAGFPNGEIYRVDNPAPKWNLARFYFKQTFGLGGGKESTDDDENQLSGTDDVQRVTVVLGKFALNDFLDNNEYSHDPRTQFLNWALMDFGAWDYAADTTGYSWGVYLELNEPRWAFRFASVLEPLYANQMQLDTKYPAARGDNLEFEYRYHLNNKKGALRILAFENHGDMGNYRETINTPADAMDITRTRSLSVKYGFGLNLEQALGQNLGAFARISWDDGHTETWAFSEIDHSITAGISASGNLWGRSGDHAGAAIVVNGLSADHLAYLADGGYGFMIGDGKLNYAPEYIGEIYYLWKIEKALGVTGDYQFVKDPAYNSDRGPVSIASVRLHMEI